MKPLQKAIAMHVGLVVGLLLASWQGAPTRLVVGVGLFILVLMNVLFWISLKRCRAARFDEPQ